MSTSEELGHEEGKLDVVSNPEEVELHPVIGLGFRTPTRPDTHQEDGTPFYKRLQVNDVV